MNPPPRIPPPRPLGPLQLPLNLEPPRPYGIRKGPPREIPPDVKAKRMQAITALERTRETLEAEQRSQAAMQPLPAAAAQINPDLLDSLAYREAERARIDAEQRERDYERYLDRRRRL